MYNVNMLVDLLCALAFPSYGQVYVLFVSKKPFHR